MEAEDSSLKHQSDRAAKPANHRVASGETLNGSVKLAAGERRILTALAQYPEGRSKVQVAVLTGYAAGGGGFNNYLGALRSHGLIQGDGDKIRIAEAGFERWARGNRCPPDPLSLITGATGWGKRNASSWRPSRTLILSG